MALGLLWLWLLLQIRKMEKDRILFLDEKKNAMAKRERLLDTLKRERQQLQERLMALHHGPHARRESKVNFTNKSISISMAFDLVLLNRF